MIKTTQLPRRFTFTHKGQPLQLPDISPVLSPEAVLNFYAATYPELTNAKITGPTLSGDEVSYSFDLVLGTKG